MTRIKYLLFLFKVTPKPHSFTRAFVYSHNNKNLNADDENIVSAIRSLCLSLFDIDESREEEEEEEEEEPLSRAHNPRTKTTKHTRGTFLPCPRFKK